MTEIDLDHSTDDARNTGQSQLGKRGEEALRKSEQRLTAIIESALDCIIGIDHEGQVTEWNPAAEKTFGYRREEAMGREMAALIIPPSLRDHHRRGLAHYLATGEGQVLRKRIELTAIRKGGVEFPVELTITPVDTEGAPAFIGYLRDITERRKAQEALRISEQRLRAVVEATPECVKIVLPDGRLDFMNSAGLCMIEAGSMESVYGATVVNLIVPEHRQEWLARHAQICGGATMAWQFEIIGNKGTRRWMETHAVPLLMPDGQTAQLAVTREITARKNADTERESLLESERAARLEAERAGRMKDEFLATLSHEIRTPLNAILGWAQIMKNSKDPEDVAQGLEVIDRNARAQAQIVEDLLDMSRIISGKVRLDVQRVDLSSIVQTAVETARPTAEAKGLRLQSIIDPLHGMVVSGDINRLQQVLWNLISNAIKFTPKCGRVQVLLERVNSHLEISVIDTGEGIAPEFLPHVFDRFRQADASTTRQHGGLGLGLSIVKQLVELHGGSIRVKSAGKGNGATFTVSLPLTILHPEPEPDTERRHPRKISNQSIVPTACDEIQDLRVVVIDDEPDARALVKRLLEDCHAKVTTTGSVDEAVALVKSGQFDVLVSDIGMPGEDGYSLIKRVRLLGKGNGGNIPAIALTAYARAEDRMKAISAGFQMHVAKPVEPAELVTMVAGAAGRTGPTLE